MRINHKTNLLIIGGDSFIAKTFIQKFSGHFNIRAISRKITGYKDELVIENFNKIPESEFYKIDAVINFAAIVHKGNKVSEKLYNEINYLLALKIANLSKSAAVSLFIQMSTIGVYGNNELISINSLENPATLYAKSKLSADKELLNLRSNTFNVIILRPPLVYGGGKAPGNMMRLIKYVAKGYPLPFKGIKNKRHFINVNNLIQYISVFIEKPQSGIYLISDNEPVSTESILRTIARYLQIDAKLIRLPKIALNLIKTLYPYEYDKLYGTLEISTNFPYEYLIQKHSVDEGISEMVNYFLVEKE